jgi:hypothetical protein
MSAKIEPAEISLDGAANLIITASGRDLRAITPPMVPGLEFNAVGQSQRVESINGVTTTSASVTYQVTAQQAGVYTIPAMARGVQPIILRVDPASGGPTVSGSAAPPPLASRNLPGGAAHFAPGGSAFVRLRLPKHEVYVGEAIPVDIQVGTRDGMVASLNGLPTLNGDAFTLDNLSTKPEQQTQEVIDGKPYTVFTWRGVLSAVKPGDLSLTMETPLTVRVQTRRSASDLFGDPMFGDLLNDPMFQNFFGGSTEREISVSSAPTAFTALELPSEGRPRDFSGAVGEFRIASELTDRELKAGDPATLRLKVSGEGNFDRVSSSMLADSAHWKTYQPTSRFTSADSTPYRGEKTFEQPIIPIDPGAQTVPALSFSYFDPRTRRYEVAQSEPLSVQVAPAPDGAVSARADQAPPSAPARAAVPSTALRPDHAPSGRHVDSLVPLYFQPRYLALPSVFMLAFPGLWFWLRRRERDAIEREATAGASGEPKRLTSEMERAAAAGDGEKFFQSARILVQRVLASRWHIAPDAVTLSEVDARLGKDSEVRGLFAIADEAIYSSRHLPKAELEHFKRTVLHELEEESIP